MTRKACYQAEQPWRGPLLLWLLLTFIAVTYAIRRGVPFRLLPSIRQRTFECAAPGATVRMHKYHDIKTTLFESRAQPWARRMLDQVTGYSRDKSLLLCLSVNLRYG